MKKLNTHRQKASALVVALLVLFIVATCIGTAIQVTTTTVKQTESSRDYSALRSAAEGALDFAYGVWLKNVNPTSYNYAPVSNKALNDALATVPSFSGFQYDSSSGYTGPQITGIDLGQYGKPYGNANDTHTPPSSTIYLDKYPGWFGVRTSYLASVRLLDSTAHSGRTPSYNVKRAMSFTVIPLFQATAFFEDRLELYKTAPMTIDGLVHTNGEAYVSQGTPGGSFNSSLTFTGNLSYAGGYVDGQWVDSNEVTRDAPPEAWTWSGYTANSSFPPTYPTGFDQQVNQVNRIEPLGLDATTVLDPNDNNPNNDSARELIEPPNRYVHWPDQRIRSDQSGTDPQAIADRRIYSKAGILVQISGSTYTVTAANGTSFGSTSAQRTATINAIKNGLSQQTIYDRREGKSVTLTSLDVGRVNTTLNEVTHNSTYGYLSGFNQILYVYDEGSSGAVPRAVRLTNGSTLPSSGLTVGSENPVYIQGNYNTSGSRVPSAVFADAVTILSNNWNDLNSAGPLSSRRASDTTVNTAIVCGEVPSGWQNPATNETYGYSGGLNNFPRFLEDWTRKDFNYTGSMIELFASQIATGEWDTGAIYVPPNRNWSFDSNFITNPPPGSLTAISIGRGALVRF